MENVVYHFPVPTCFVRCVHLYFKSSSVACTIYLLNVKESCRIDSEKHDALIMNL